MLDSSNPCVAGSGTAVYATPGHPVAAGAGYDCNCGECFSRRSWIDSGFSPDQMAAWTAAGYATPSTFAVRGKQFVVIAAGGGKLGSTSSDTYVAYALP